VSGLAQRADTFRACVRRSRRRFCRWPRRSTGGAVSPNYVVYPLVYRRAVELSAFTTIVAVLIAGSLLGVVGAILAVPFAAVIKIVLREAGAPRRTRMAALRDS
jgi:hypothetical protein